MASINVSCPSTTPLSRPQACKNFKLFNGLHTQNLSLSNGNMSSIASIEMGSKFSFSNKGVSRIRATMVSEESDLVYTNGNGAVTNSTLIDDQSVGIEIQPDAVAFGTLSADTVPTTSGFPVDNDEFDLDCPTKGFASIPEAIEDIRQGKMVVVVDDEDRENEGDLIMAAQLVTPEAMAFIVKHSTGIVCVSMDGKDLERLQLPLMVTQKDNDEKLRTAFTVTVDAKNGTTTGVSAHDRATTVLALASRDSKPDDFNRPGHIFPLKYREGGVLKRAGHTEASVDLAVLAGLDPVAVLCEVVDDDGSMARLPKLRQFAQRENLKIVSIADLIRYRRKRDKLVDRAGAARIPTMWGPFTAHCYRSILDGIEHIAMVKGDIGKIMEQHKQQTLVTPLVSLFFILLSSLNVTFATSSPGESPFTPKAHLIRYWNKAVQNDAEKPSFLLSKASPLSAVDSAAFAELAAQNALSTRLQEFCSSANLLCFPDVGQSLENHDGDTNFTAYSTKNFTNYGTARWAGVDSFKNYSVGDTSQVDSFRRYSRDSVNHTDDFNSYGQEANLVDQSFNSYATGAVAGTGEFKNYADSVNVPNLRFNSYSDDSTERAHAFTAYSENANAGDQSFTSYSKHGNGAPNEFTGYGTDANSVGSGFTGYSEAVNGADDKFNNYGNNQNNPQNKFKSYGDSGNAAVETFTSYRDSANVGDDSFQSYAKNSDGEKVNFANYGKSFEVGSDKFTGYGKGARGESVGFEIYGVNNSFSDYAKNESITFKGYAKLSGSLVKRRVEPGKFFRESMLKKGKVMPMPDIQDKMPKRSFLPRFISSKLPFATSKIYELKRIFQAPDNSTMEKIMLDALRECERAPSAGETKRCVASAEDMIDFATSVLGANVVVRTTDNVNGSSHDVLIGSVKGINGGNVTKSVSCHQSLFPYLLYYCHSVPKVRVYEADLLDPISKAKINHGVAICHLDTSAWSPTHGAFVALGSGPGRIEVCHWIFQNDMTWAVAD